MTGMLDKVLDYGTWAQHNRDVTWATRRLKSQLSRLFVQQRTSNSALLNVCKGNQVANSNHKGQVMRNASPCPNVFMLWKKMTQYLQVVIVQTVGKLTTKYAYSVEFGNPKQASIPMHLQKHTSKLKNMQRFKLSAGTVESGWVFAKEEPRLMLLCNRTCSGFSSQNFQLIHRQWDSALDCRLFRVFWDKVISEYFNHWNIRVGGVVY